MMKRSFLPVRQKVPGRLKQSDEGDDRAGDDAGRHVSLMQAKGSRIHRRGPALRWICFLVGVNSTMRLNKLFWPDRKKIGRCLLAHRLVER